MAARKRHRKRKHSILRIALRLTAGLFLLVLIVSCGNIPGLQEERVSSYIRVPFVRVLLDEQQASAAVSGEGAFAVECVSGEKQTVYYSSNPVRVESRQLSLAVYDQTGNVIEEGLNEVNVLPRGSGRRLILNGHRYRGMFKVVPHGQNVQIVNIIYMEDYLRGVVPPEIGKRSPEEIEAVKAQAVAARTYAMSHLNQYGGQPYDIKSGIIDQLYEGIDVEEPLVSRAIDQTAGVVAMYQDKFIDAYYHSTCGGFTDDITDVWDRQELPYLKPVVDGDACSWSKYFRWSEVFTEQQLRGRLEQYLASDRGRDLRIGRITDVQIIGRTAGGRVAQMMVRTELDVFRFYKDRIRWVVGRTSNPDLILPSDRFDVELQRDAQGNLVQITFRGQGYGHGVGMCQCGAIGHARTGWAFEKILAHYYTGIEIKKLY